MLNLEQGRELESNRFFIVEDILTPKEYMAMGLMVLKRSTEGTAYRGRYTGECARCIGLYVKP